MLNTINHNNILEINLARPPVNALNIELIQKLTESIQQNITQSQAIIISGQPGMFSAGLDVVELIQLDKSGIKSLWQSFLQLLKTISCSPIPIVASITGHNPAGGAVISIFCDYRIMTQGNFKMGLNEVQVGIPVPDIIQYALARLIGKYPAERLIVAGSMLNPEQAYEIGLVDQLAEPNDATQQAITWCEQLLKLPNHAMLKTRELMRSDFVEAFNTLNTNADDAFVENWFHPETQQTLKQLVKQLTAK